MTGRVSARLARRGAAYRMDAHEIRAALTRPDVSESAQLDTSPTAREVPRLLGRVEDVARAAGLDALASASAVVVRSGSADDARLVVATHAEEPLLVADAIAAMASSGPHRGVTLLVALSASQIGSEVERLASGGPPGGELTAARRLARVELTVPELPGTNPYFPVLDHEAVLARGVGAIESAGLEAGGRRRIVATTIEGGSRHPKLPPGVKARACFDAFVEPRMDEPTLAGHVRAAVGDLPVETAVRPCSPEELGGVIRRYLEGDER